eukprot:gene5273-6731_t
MITAEGGEAFYLHADVSKAADCEAMGVNTEFLHFSVLEVALLSTRLLSWQFLELLRHTSLTQSVQVQFSLSQAH